MKIGVIGVGIVGKAILSGFKELGHDIKFHDIAMNTKLEDVLDTKLCFICVPTPSKDSGECDSSIVESVIADLKRKNYNGLMCIKSTVSPGVTKLFQKEYGKNICFIPEFLKERSAYEDFVYNHDLCVIGTTSDEYYKLVKQAHGHYPKKFVQLTETEAEFCKYFNNIYNASLITFANSMYEVCKSMDVNYNNIKNAIVNRSHIHDYYLNCSEALRGFGGMCLPKDTKAMDYVAKKRGLDVEFFKNIIEENNKYEITVFEGMRKE